MESVSYLKFVSYLVQHRKNAELSLRSRPLVLDLTGESKTINIIGFRCRSCPNAKEGYKAWLLWLLSLCYPGDLLSHSSIIANFE